jgi:hypothetical protein
VALAKQTVGDFRERIKQREAEIDQQVEQALGDSVTYRDQIFSQQASRLFREAYWIRQTNQFPDGQPQRTQHRWHLELWDLFLAALEARTNGVENWNPYPEEPSGPEQINSGRVDSEQIAPEQVGTE